MLLTVGTTDVNFDYGDSDEDKIITRQQDYAASEVNHSKLW